MPGVELGSALVDRVRGSLGVKQVIVLVDAEAFAQHCEAQLTSKVDAVDARLLEDSAAAGSW